MSSAGRFRFGTSSWSEKSWVGPFYPKGSKPGDYLTEYARHFDTVEADVTYYRVPDARLVDGWLAKTPDHFVLSAKFPRSVVHCGEGPQPNPERLLVPRYCAADTEDFLVAMDRLGSKCGPLVLQFPYFNRRTFSAPGPFLERLDSFLSELPERFRYAVEIRNKSWLGPDLLEVLRRHRCALVLVDLVYMPHPDEFADRLDWNTTDFTYCRLIGDRKAVDKRTKTFDRIVLDQSARLDRWATLLKKVLAQVPTTYAYANNHYAGHGPATILELAAKLGLQPPEQETK